MPHRLFASNSVVDYVANVFETVYMHCKLFLTHSYQNDLPSKFNYGHWIGNVVLELDRVGLLLALLLLFLGALCVFSWPSGRINNGAERFRRGTLFRWKMNRASIFSLVGFASVHSVEGLDVEEKTSGTCAVPLTEKECTDHAMSLSLFEKALKNNNYPKGCYIKATTGKIFFNRYTKSNVDSCSAALKCLCKVAHVIEELAEECTEHLTQSECQKYAENNNISAPFLRPKSISKDNTPMKDVILQVLEYYKDNNYFPTAVVLLQPTSPFRTKSTIIKAYNIFIKKKLDSLFSVEKIKHTHHPSYVFHDKKELLKSKLKNLNNKKNRQVIKDMYALDGGVIFITKSKIVKKSIIAGKIDYIEVFQPESFDIDTHDDLRLCKMINVKL